MEDNKKINETLGLLNIEENLKVLNEKLKESQERVRMYASAFGQLREETERFADVLPKLNWTKNFFEKMLPIEDISNIGRSLSELEKYELKRQAIIEKRDKVLNKKESSDVDKKLAYVTEEEEVQALNIATLKKTEIWTKLFTSIDKLSKRSIKSQIADIDSLIKYVKTNGNDGAIPAGFSKDDIVLINEMTAGYAAGTDAAKNFVKETETASAGLKKSLDELLAKNHINKIIEGFKGLGGAATSSKKELESVNNILDGFKGVGSAFSEVGKAMDEAGIKAGKVVVTIGDVITKTASMAGAGASVGGPWGAIIGAVVGLAGSLVPLLKGTNELTETTRHYYASIIKASDELINKYIKLIESTTGLGTTIAADIAKVYLDYQKKTQDEYIIEYLTNRDGNSRTNRHETTKRFKTFFNDNSNMKEILGGGDDLALGTWDQSLLGKHINNGVVTLKPSEIYFDIDKLKEAKIDPVLFLTDINKAITTLDANQIRVLKQHGVGIWAQLDEETQKYLESVIAYEDKIEEIKRAKRESDTGTTFDKLLADLNKLAFQADLTGKKIGDSFAGHMGNAIQNIVKKNYLSKELTTWYDEFSQKMADGELNKDDADYLRTEYERIVNEGNRQYNAAMTAAGLKIPGAETDQKSEQTRTATAQGITAMSQDTASELNGNFYALFMTVDGIYQILSKKQEQEISKEYSLPTLQEMLTVSKSSNTYLLDIRNNTSHLIAIDSNIEYMNNNILALRNEGVKIRS